MSSCAVLVVDDEAAMRTALEASFRRNGWNVATASGAGDALAKFRTTPCPLVVTDVRMPDGDGLQVMQGVREMAPETAVIFLTAYGTVTEAVQAIKEGACDYLMKPVSFDRLRETAERVLSMARTPGNAKQSNGAAAKLVGRSPAFARLLEKARQVARTGADVLIEAESGTGKELVARLIHLESARRDGPFVAINCSAFPEHLLESELFGHARGAFTGANMAKPGKFELAGGGTILLDEVGEMPLALQPKLLRVLQEREVDPLGGTRTVPLDVRVIATTNRPLRAGIAAGEFRSDLYYRLNVVPLTVPPLRERREDILELAAHFLRKHAPGSGDAYRIAPELARALQSHDWPGNVRELENFIRRSLALSTGRLLGPELLAHLETSPETQRPSAIAAGVSLRDAERELLERTLEATGGNRTRAAELMGVSLRTVRNKIRNYGLPARRYA
ncbi:MAG TPA: sigma-54 dependent transcriptional regulator [Candidatus Acidoferrum sp.]|jgi:DNA-binding NtrC family response regulator|nr:sigma-54 dependent transcriptional regulator [Candidatus Acidoferrum sp.]